MFICGEVMLFEKYDEGRFILFAKYWFRGIKDYGMPK